MLMWGNKVWGKVDSAKTKLRCPTSSVIVEALSSFVKLNEVQALSSCLNKFISTSSML